MTGGGSSSSSSSRSSSSSGTIACRDATVAIAFVPAGILYSAFDRLNRIGDICWRFRHRFHSFDHRWRLFVHPNFHSRFRRIGIFLLLFVSLRNSVSFRRARPGGGIIVTIIFTLVQVTFSPIDGGNDGREMDTANGSGRDVGRRCGHCRIRFRSDG